MITRLLHLVFVGKIHDMCGQDCVMPMVSSVPNMHQNNSKDHVN